MSLMFTVTTAELNGEIGPMDERKFEQTHTAFSGAKFDPEWITGITWQVHRDPAPIYRPADYVPKRFIHGQLISETDVKMDEPFDVTITFENDEGRQATRIIYGVTLEEDVVSGKTCNWIARDIGPSYSSGV
jgi:hypothetical protein